MKKFTLAPTAADRAAATLLVAFSIVGCATPPKGEQAAALPGVGSGGSEAAAPSTAATPLTPAERRLRDQSHAFARTVWEGSLLGVGASGLMAFLTGQELVMLAGGGAAGGLAGSYVAHKQRQYSKQEEVLDAMIADVRKSNEETEALIASVQEVIAEDQRRLAEVQQQVRKGEATQAALDSTRRRIADNRAVIVQAGNGAQEKQAMFQGAERQYREANPGTNTARMQQELNAFSQHIKTLDSLVQRVTAA